MSKQANKRPNCAPFHASIGGAPAKVQSQAQQLVRHHCPKSSLAGRGHFLQGWQVTKEGLQNGTGKLMCFRAENGRSERVNHANSTRSDAGLSLSVQSTTVFVTLAHDLRLTC